jgi:hypothetical protein
MPVLRPYLIPTLGTPQPVVAPPHQQRQQLRQQRNISPMNTEQFYTNQYQSNQQLDPSQQYQTTQQTVTDRQQPDPTQDFEPSSNTAPYLQEQFQNYANRIPAPVLNPGDRVKSPNAELVQPDNFKVFYGQLDAITQTGNEALGAEEARSAYKRMQQLQAIQDRQIPAFNGVNYNPGSGGGGGNYGSVGSGLGGSPAANFRIAQNMARQFGWGPSEINAWYQLGMKESGWRNTAQNPTSTAYGIGQFLDSTWGGYGVSKTSDPGKQILAMARYIKARYGSPSRALSFHIGHNWY